MLCEVQADAAARTPRQQYQANLAAILVLGQKLLDDRRNDSPLDQQQLDSLYNTEVNKSKT